MVNNNDKTIAVLSYLTFLGWIIALVMYQSNKTALGGFHIRQTLLLFIASFVLGIVSIVPIIGWLLRLLFIAIFIFWIMGLVSAIKGEMKPLPVIGDLAQDWFKGI